jgi:hypothetical protein
VVHLHGTLTALLAVAAVPAPVRADEAHVRVGVAFAATVEAGERSGVTIAVEQDERGPLVTISQVLAPLAASPAFPLAAPEGCGDAAALEVPASFSPPPAVVSAVAGSSSALEALVGVVSYVSRRIMLDESDGGPQDAKSVLLRGSGHCSGRANLTVGLLRSVGIPARVVHGVLLERRSVRWHRWGEAWLGSLGWVPFDPGAAAGVVSVHYLPCRAVIPGLEPQGVSVERIDDRCYRRLPRRAGLTVPLLRGVNLRCLAPVGVSDITAILVGPDGTRWSRRGETEVDFSGLQPAHYWLTWQGAGIGAARLALDLRRQGDVRLVLPPGRAATAPVGRTPVPPSEAGRSDS